MDILGFLKKNRALIGTCGGILGTIGTGLLAARAALRADKELNGNTLSDGKEKLRVIAKHASLPMLSCVFTSFCILDAHNTHVNSRIVSFQVVLRCVDFFSKHSMRNALTHQASFLKKVMPLLSMLYSAK